MNSQNRLVTSFTVLANLSPFSRYFILKFGEHCRHLLFGTILQSNLRRQKWPKNMRPRAREFLSNARDSKSTRTLLTMIWPIHGTWHQRNYKHFEVIYPDNQERSVKTVRRVINNFFQWNYKFINLKWKSSLWCKQLCLHFD